MLPHIGDDRGAVLDASDAGEAHSGALEEPFRVGQEGVQIVVTPDTAAFPEGVGISEAVARTLILADDAPQVGPDLVAAAVVEGVAGGAAK